jgi:pyruvate kinase
MEGRKTVLPANKTKIVCTIGPASASPGVLERMIEAGMNVARINLSHGEPADHARSMALVRDAAARCGRRVAIMADLPGPKIRIGELEREPIDLQDGADFTLSTAPCAGDASRVQADWPPLPRVVHAGTTLFINDGLIQLEVRSVEGEEVHCRVVVGGELRSRKGLNLPGIDLGISAFTEHDRECLRFAIEQGVDAVSQSFVASADDLAAVREAALEFGGDPFLIAKIERLSALENLDEILVAADGLMVARGDLGVEIPIEQMAIVQKDIMSRANRAGKPVITATHMLESMVQYRRPTRAEATDVANAILDGTDCVMLSGESAVGKHPVEAAKMLARIAAYTEPHRPQDHPMRQLRMQRRGDQASVVDLIALSVHRTFEHAHPEAVVVPTRSGATARNVARFRLPVWIVAFSPVERTCQDLQFSYGVYPVAAESDQEDWEASARSWLGQAGISEGLALLTQGPSSQNPAAPYRLEILELGGRGAP